MTSVDYNLLHYTACRLLKSAPPRTLSWMLALFSVLGMAINAVVAAFEA